MKLILLSQIHKQCWKDSCPICPSWRMMSTAHYPPFSTVFQTLQAIPLPNPWLLMRRERRVWYRKQMKKPCERSECGSSHKQQGRVPLHSALSLPPWPVAAVRTAAGRHDWPGWGSCSPTTNGSNSNGKGLDRWQKFQHCLRIGCALSYSAGHDEQGQFASAYFGEVSHQCICVYVAYIKDII